MTDLERIKCEYALKALEDWSGEDDGQLRWDMDALEKIEEWENENK